MRPFPIGIVAAVIALPSLHAQSPSPAEPIGRYDVVAELPGMGRAPNVEATAARRRALLLRIGHGAVLIPAGHERDLEKDYVQDNDFRQWNTFFYFTELETQDAWLLMTARGPDSLETVLFLPPRDPSQERWTGLRLGYDGPAARLSGIATVLPIDSLDQRLLVARFRSGGAIYAPPHPKTPKEPPLPHPPLPGA